MTPPRPKTPPGSADHIFECAFVMEVDFLALAESMEASGWSRETVALALGDLASARIELLEAEKVMPEAIALRRQEH